MRMNKQKSPLWLYLPLLLAVVLLPPVLAQTPAEDAQKPPPATEPARQTSTEGEPQTPLKPVPAKPVPAKPVVPKQGPQPGFTPTEKITADSAVSFPIDI